MRSIELRGVRVHNLKNIDVDIPLGRITMITGVSGSGKSSLAFDTLYAEGQRRYIESFSAYARRFLDRLDKPDSDRIDNLPPAIALRQNEARRRRRDSIAAVTEIDGYLRLLLTRLGHVICTTCGTIVTRSSAENVVACLATHVPSSNERSTHSARGIIAFPLDRATTAEGLSSLQRLGLTRAIAGETTTQLTDLSLSDIANGNVLVVIDRITLGKTTTERLTESTEAAFRIGQGRCIVLLACRDSNSSSTRQYALSQLDGEAFQRIDFSMELSCTVCNREFVQPEPFLFNARSPLGACPSCHGDGRMIEAPLTRLVPDPARTLEQDAFFLLADARWKHERRKLLEFAQQIALSVKRPFQKLTAAEQQLLMTGDSNLGFDGVIGFLKRLRHREHVPSVSRYLAHWCNVKTCSMCSGTGLRDEARAVRLVNQAVIPDSIGSMAEPVPSTFGWGIEELLGQPIELVLHWLKSWSERLNTDDQAVAKHIVPELLARLEQLADCGLGYLSLGRSLNSLSHGEAQRVTLSSVLASRLVNTLFVLDEPSAGLHARDFPSVLRGIQRLKDAGNTVVVIEHEPQFVAIADQHITFGPGAGSNGGRVLSQTEAEQNATSLASSIEGIQDRRRISESRLNQQTHWIELSGIRHRNLRGIDVRLPLGCLCVVTGVSGAGKTSLVEGTLWPALCQQLQRPCSATQVGRFDALQGVSAIDDVLFVDDAPLLGGSRSNPATWLKAFDEIRKLFAEAAEAKKRALTPAYFSLNNEQGGRCPHCEGTGIVAIDMQFLADVVMRCPECQGQRFTREALEITWRNLSIADVLALTASDAFLFFKGQRRLQRRLKSLKDVGIGYLTLGQPLNTLSGGEAQRLKLAATLARSHRSRTLILMNEPSTGLHPLDVEHLLKCFDDLLNVGQSLVVVENDSQILARADYVVELGPGGGPQGGHVVRQSIESPTCR